MRAAYAVLASILWVTPVFADIDISLRPAGQTATVGDVISFDVVASSDDGTTQLLTVAEVVFTWDPGALMLIDSFDDCALLSCPPGPNCLGSSFPVAAAINESDPPADGDGLVQILANPVVGPIPAPPEGRILTTLDFVVLATTPSSAVTVEASFGIFNTVVFGTGILNNVTGLLSGAKVVVPEMPTMSLTADPQCATAGEMVDVTLRLENLIDILTYQARLSFDSSRLSFVGGAYDLTIFETPFKFPIVAVGEDIDVSAGDFDGPTSADQDVVVLTFEALVDGCVTGVFFRDTLPGNGSFVADGAGEVPTLLQDLLPVDDGNACTDDTCACDPDPRVCHTPVDCSDGDPCTTDTCDPATGCQHQPIDCDDGIACTVDSCVAGGCVNTPTNALCDDGNECTSSVCDPLDGAADADGCVDSDEPAGTACGDPTNTKCNPMDTCDGMGNCEDNFLPAGATCGDATDTECDDPDTCDGAGICLPNFAGAGTACGDPGDSDCNDPDTCDGAGMCDDNLQPAGAACTDDGNSCTEDICDAAGTCEHPPANAGVLCEGDGDLCTIEACDAVGSCNPIGAVNCPAPSGACDGGTECNPATGMCDPLPDAAMSTTCDADGDLCTIDHCDGAGACVQLSTVTCNAPTGPCDGGESCNPATGLCDDLPDEPMSTACEVDGDLCTLDHCNGTGDCVQMAVVDCLDPTGPCDGGETCNPASGLCEENADAPLSTACEDDDDLCTIEHCDGAGSCVLFDMVVCLPTQECDPATGECTGCLIGDMNNDGLCTVVFDAELFEQCVYSMDCDGPAMGMDDLLCPADCNCDGMATIIPDAECFVTNNYDNNECGVCPLDQQAPEPGTIGGAVYDNPNAKLASGLEGVLVIVSRNGRPVARTRTDELGLWKVEDLADGNYKVIFGNDRSNAIGVVVSEENQAQNLSITRLHRD